MPSLKLSISFCKGMSLEDGRQEQSGLMADLITNEDKMEHKPSDNYEDLEVTYI